MASSVNTFSGKKTRVLIVEDHTALAENLFEFLGEQRYVLDFAPDGLTGLHLAATHHYDVIVLDVMLPGIDGFELCQRLRNDIKSNVPILLLTAKDSLEDKEIGFTGGADDYLTKPFDMKELEWRITALSRRQSTPTATLSAGDIHYSPGTLEVRSEDDRSVTLTGIGANIFEVLIRAYPNYVKRHILMEEAWNDDGVDPHTLRSHVYALRKNLKAAIGRSLIQTVHGKGYRLNPDPEAEND